MLATFANGLRVVEALAQERLSLRELSDMVGLPRQTTYRLARTLVELGWATRDEATDTYMLTLHIWGMAVQSFKLTDLRDALSPSVQRLAEKYGETVHLAVYEAGSSVYIDKADGSHPIRSYTALGGRAPAYCVATGKALLAYQSEAERERVIHEELVTYTPETITDQQRLRQKLSEVRRQGFAVNGGEWRAEVGGIAVPILGPFGEVVAALGFSGPVERILQRRDTLLDALNEEIVSQDLPALLPQATYVDSRKPAAECGWVLKHYASD